MSLREPIDVVLCWHMHQPWYLRDGTFTQPWVYLHGLKSYSDMAAHLETVQGARAVVNFVPTLLEQLVLYSTNIAAHLAVGAPLADPLLAALVADPLPGEPEARQKLVKACLMVNERHVLGRHAPYARLAELARAAGPDAGRYLGDRFLADLIGWFHIGWFGEHRLRASPDLQALVARGGDFSVEDRRTLLFLIGRELNGLIPRYRALAESGRVELSVSPWAHPILPLLVDFATGREALPELTLPAADRYPGGEARVRWQLEQGIGAFRDHFGFAPSGCWPSEGAVSDAAVAAIGAAGFRWLASGGQVLNNSLAETRAAPDCRHRFYRVGGSGPACFFRDDGLSDLIGFSYQHWNAGDAVDNLIGHIENIAAHCDCPDAVVAIVMDGENAWEHYPANGFDFLQTLYRRLADHPGIRLTTFSEHLDRQDVRPVELSALTAGSWVHGTLATWIGNAPKNRAWELLVAAKGAWDRRIAEGFEPDAAALRELALCEGSDWFWWLDEFNEAETVGRFEGLFRTHLRALYRILGISAPAALEESLVIGSVAGAVPVMRPTHG
jgi:alpha-amylase/alpha-mannosidase (GH57 family)